MISLAIDPAFGKSRKASKIGFAYFEDGHLGDHGEIPVEDARAWPLRKAMLAPADVLIIEDQYLDKNPETLKGLIKARCLWAIPAADQFNLKVVEMAPSEWQSKVSRSWQAGKPVNKQEILFYLRARFELTAVGLDELSAISMGAVWWDRERFNGRVKG